MSNIGFFGGTFNPPHLAHKRLALHFQKEADLDKILVVPTFVPPHKAAAMLAPGEDRLAMCRFLFREDIFSVSDMELRRKGKSYSFDTLTQLKKFYPDDKLFMIIGSDMLLSFHQWYRYRDILKLVTLCAASRDGKEGADKLSDYAASVLGLDAAKGEIIISVLPPVELSSTQIRRMITDGENAEEYLGKEVSDYIKKRDLYHELS